MLLQIPKTSRDGKFTCEKYKYAPVISNERRKMNFLFLSSASSAFRSTVLGASWGVKLAGHSMHKRNFPLALH